MIKFFIIFFIILIFPSSISFSKPPDSDTIIKQVVERVYICESNGKHEGVWGDVNYIYPAYGICQMQKRTFYWLSKKAGFKNLKWKNKEDQILLLEWSIRNGWGDLWTCFRKLYRNVG